MTAPTDPRVLPGERGSMSRSQLRDLFKEHGGSFHGPHVEHASCEEEAFYRFLDDLQERIARATIVDQAAEIARLTADNDLTKAALDRVLGVSFRTAERAEAAEARVAELVAAVEWALGGEGSDFRPRRDGEGAYWWRTELRQRAKIVSGEAKDAPSPAEGERS